MNAPWLAYSAAAALALSGCESTDPDVERFVADLNGAREVPPRTTPAVGSAEFTLEENGTVTYTLEASSINNVFAAHIHGPAGTEANAGVVVTLFTASPPLAQVNGTLRSGTFAQADLGTGGAPLAPMDSVLTWMRTGRAYVNVHTNDGADPSNTGAGDFQAGEIRGQIQRR